MILNIFKNSFLEQFTGSVSAVDMLISLGVAFIIGMFIIYVYRKTYTGVVYSKAFSLCILMLAMVTAMIIRTISSNISLSLGMVGALSIVRFRTAIKEPVDTGFMFWGIAAGIMCGAGLYIPALVATLMVGVLYFGAYLMGFRTANRYLLVLKYKADWLGKKAININKYFPSSQVCNRCEYKNEEVKDLSVRKWICPKCGFEHDRDINASVNIMFEGLKIYMKESII